MIGKPGRDLNLVDERGGESGRKKEKDRNDKNKDLYCLYGKYDTTKARTRGRKSGRKRESE
jgi:hypothetical protein